MYDDVTLFMTPSISRNARRLSGVTVRLLTCILLLLCQKCAAAFRRNGSAQYAKETYVKMGNTAELMEVYMETEKWEEAFLLLDQHPQMAHKVCVCVANVLLMWC
jgi:hypothetical protein